MNVFTYGLTALSALALTVVATIAQLQPAAAASYNTDEATCEIVGGSYNPATGRCSV